MHSQVTTFEDYASESASHAILIFKLVVIGMSYMVLSGCAGYQFITYSVPDIDHPRITVNRHPYSFFVSVLHADDYEMFVDTNNVISYTHILLPIPFPQLTPPEVTSGPHYQVMIAIKPTSRDMEMDYARISYLYGEQRYTPISMSSKVNCDSYEIDDIEYNAIGITPVKLKSDEYSCYWVSFDAPAPDPRKRFAFEINGMVEDDNNYSMPIIWFSGKKYNSSFSLP